MQESTLVSIAKFLKIGNSKEEKKVGRTTPGITVIIFPLPIVWIFSADNKAVFH